MKWTNDGQNTLELTVPEAPSASTNHLTITSEEPQETLDVEDLYYQQTYTVTMDPHL